MSKRVLIGMVAMLAVGFAACGSSSKDHVAAGGDTVKITMTDNAFSPNTVKVKSGATVTFEFTNDGKVAHEAVIGDAAMQAAHEAEMNGKSGNGGSDMGGMTSTTMASGSMATTTAMGSGMTTTTAMGSGMTTTTAMGKPMTTTTAMGKPMTRTTAALSQATSHGTKPNSNSVTVAPGKTGELTYTFKASDNGIIIGCHEKGHYAAGMKVTVTVES